VSLWEYPSDSTVWVEDENFAFNSGNFSLHFPDPENDVQAMLLRFEPVPERGTWLMVAVGIGVIAAARRRLSRLASRWTP
jgi:hypothetical protein